MGLNAEGQAWLLEALADASGAEVTYERPSTGARVTLTAWVGRTAFRQNPQPGAPGAYLIWGERDYIFPVASLVLDGVQSQPMKGDRVTEAGAGTFEVLPQNGEPAWRFSDASRTAYRVHTKRAA